MNIHALSENYGIRKLKEEDIPLILDVCLGNPQFYLYTQAKPEEENIRYDMQALPPGKQIQDKYYIGFFKEDRLYAIMDLIGGYAADASSLKRHAQKLGIWHSGSSGILPGCPIIYKGSDGKPNHTELAVGYNTTISGNHNGKCRHDD